MAKPSLPPTQSGPPLTVRVGTGADEWLDQGFKAFRKEQFEEAARAWGNPLLAGQPRAMMLLAEARFRLALSRPEPAKAIPELRLALEAAPEDGRIWYHLGLALYRERDLEGAWQALAQAERHGFTRLEPLVYVQGLLALERDCELGPGDASLALLAPFQALLRDDWTALAASAPMPAVAHAKGTPVVPGMVSLLRGLGQAGLGRWAQAAQTLGSLSQDLFPGPLEALRVVFLGRALDGLGRTAEARKLRMAALGRTKNATLAAEVGQAGLADLEAWLAQGRWAEVAREAQAFLKSVPSPRARVAAAIALDHLGREAAARRNWAEAENHWRALLRLGGEPFEGVAAIHHNLALACEGQELWDKAASAWEASLAALPRRITKAQIKAGTAFGGLSPEALLARRAWLEKRALELRQRSNNVEAILRQRKALIKREPQNLELRLEQAEMLMGLDRTREAERELQALLRRVPEHPGALEAIARIQLLEGYTRAAEGTLRRVLAVEPTRASARLELAHALAYQTTNLPGGTNPVAMRMLEEAIALAPREGGIRLTLASRFLAGGAKARAMEQVEQALLIDKRAWAEIFRFWARHGNLAEARKLLARGEGEGVLELGFFLKAGLACLEAASSAGDAFPGARKGSAMDTVLKNKVKNWLDLGRSLLDRAAALEPGLETLTDLVGNLLVAHPDLAVPYAEQASVLSPDDPSVLMDLAVAQSGARQFEAARATLKRVERAARKHKDRDDVAAIQGMLGMIPIIGVEALHAVFAKAMLEDFGPGDLELDDEGIPF